MARALSFLLCRMDVSLKKKAAPEMGAALVKRLAICKHQHQHRDSEVVAVLPQHRGWQQTGQSCL